MEAAQVRKRAVYRQVTQAPAPRMVHRAAAQPAAATTHDAGDDGDDNALSDGGSDYSSVDSAASREQMRAQLDDLKDIVRVMVRGLRACDAAQVRMRSCFMSPCFMHADPCVLSFQMALRDEMATQKAGLSKLKGLATLRADLEAQHSQLQARVASLERMLGQVPGFDAAAPAAEEAALPRKPPVPRRSVHAAQPPKASRLRGEARVTPAPQGRRVRFVAAPGDAGEAQAADPVTAYSHHPPPPVDDDDLFAGGADVALPSYAELRAAAAPSLPAELRLAGELPTGPAPALSAAAWRFASVASAALAAPEPPRPVAMAPLPSVATRARTRQAQAGLDNSFSLARHAGLA